MHRFNSIFNNKIFRYSFILFIALGFCFLFPNDTYALEYRNPKMEVWGTMPNSSTLTTLISCDACSRIENVEGTPQFIRIYLPGSLFTSYVKYDVSFQFKWVYLGSNDVWPRYPILFLHNGVLNTNEVVSSYGVHNWTYLSGVYQYGYWFRDHTFGSTFTVDYLNTLTDYFYLDIPFFETNNGNSSPYTLALELELDHIDIIAEGSDEHLGIVIDNAKNELIDKIVESGHADQERFDELMDSIMDSDVSGSQGFAKDFFNMFKDDDNHGLSSIVSTPLKMIRSLISSSDESRCSNLNFEILGTSVYFPSGCSFWSKVPTSVISLYYLIFCGFFGYKLVVVLFKDVQQLKNPNSSGVSVLDL